MNAYQTLLGKRLELDRLPLDLQSIALRVLAFAEANDGDAFEFASRCRRLFRRAFVRPDAYHAAMRGPVGDMYRDRFYRIFANSLKDGEREAFLESIRHNPLRLLFDRYLDGTWRYQADFAQDAGLNDAQVARAFKKVLGGSGSGEISVSKMAQAFAALGIVPDGSPAFADSSLGEFTPLPSAPTAREWLLLLLASSVTRCLCQVESRVDDDGLIACRDVLAHYLSVLYDIQDYNHLTDFTYRVLRELLATYDVPSTEDPPADDTARSLLLMAINPDEQSFKLLTTPEIAATLGQQLEQSRRTSVHLPSALAASGVEHEPLFPEDPDLSPQERQVLANIGSSEWARALIRTWTAARQRVKKWSDSNLAGDALQDLIDNLHDSKRHREENRDSRTLRGISPEVVDRANAA